MSHQTRGKEDGLGRRQFLAAAGSGLLLVVGNQASAATPPSGPIKIIVPFGAGSGTDIIARTIAEELQNELHASFLVENREGASGIVGVTAAARAPADGRTLLMTSTTTITSNPYLFKTLPYDPVKDFRPVAGIVETTLVLMVRANSPVENLDQLLATVRSDPKAAYGYGSGGAQVAGASFTRRAKLATLPVPYKSSPQAITDLIGGRLAYIFLDSGAAVEQVKSGQLRAIAIASQKRSPHFPNTPTFQELGINFNCVGWIGLLAPAAVPDAQVNAINAAVNKILQKPAVRQRVGATGDILAMSAREFAAYLEAQSKEWGEMIREANIEKQ